MDEFARLKQALAEDEVRPSNRARESAIAAALQAYDEKSDAARQASGFGARLRIAANAASEILTGKKTMRMTHALAGGASLVVLTLAVMSVATLQYPGAIPEFTEFPAAKLPAPELPADAPAAPPPPAVPQTAAVDAMADSSKAAREVASVAPAATVAAGQERLERRALAAQQESAAGAPAADAAVGFAPAPAMQAPAMAPDQPHIGYRDQGRDRFEAIDTNPLKVTAEAPVSTFSVDVDTASYSFVRASLNNGVLPQEDAVRVEELVNYFPYDYPGPQSREEPFRANVAVTQTPWNPATKLLTIGIKGFEILPAERPPANLVFLLDTSGSMDEPNKLPLLVNSLKLLVDSLGPQDRVAIVAYAGGAGTVLEPTPASDKASIVAALENLWAGGSTAGGEGIRQAYALAQRSLVEGGVNRVILATDGDFNVGITDTEELKSFVERQRETGIFLSVLGFGMGNYNDELMQALAQNGNGAAAYIDTLNEARKVLVEEAGSTMFPIAKDVKLQVEFNPATVSEYRLIGYETRLLAREDFNNDRVDAGEIGSGHTVTALYEITPVGSPGELVGDLRYGAGSQPARPAPPAPREASTGGEYAFLKIRYKLPDSDTSRLIETPITPANEMAGGVINAEAQFAAAVAAFGQILRGGQYTGRYTYDDVIALAQENKARDEFGYRAEFVKLVRLAKTAAPMVPARP
jgi:Ca-activated chloride channel family protein